MCREAGEGDGTAGGAENATVIYIARHTGSPSSPSLSLTRGNHRHGGPIFTGCGGRRVVMRVRGCTHAVVR